MYVLVYNNLQRYTLVIIMKMLFLVNIYHDGIVFLCLQNKQNISRKYLCRYETHVPHNIQSVVGPRHARVICISAHSRFTSVGKSAVGLSDRLRPSANCELLLLIKLVIVTALDDRKCSTGNRYQKGVVVFKDKKTVVP